MQKSLSIKPRHTNPTESKSFENFLQLTRVVFNFNLVAGADPSEHKHQRDHHPYQPKHHLQHLQQRMVFPHQSGPFLFHRNGRVGPHNFGCYEIWVWCFLAGYFLQQHVFCSVRVGHSRMNFYWLFGFYRLLIGCM